jgi:hypothetical protein
LTISPYLAIKGKVSTTKRQIYAIEPCLRAEGDRHPFSDITYYTRRNTDESIIKEA